MAIDREALRSGTRPEIDGGRLLLTRADGFDGYEIMEYRGLVWGISIRAKDLGRDIFMGCKMLTGGELSSYSQLSHESRQRALDEMIEMAKRQGANGVINILFEISHMQGQTQVSAYGTAVIIRPVINYVPPGGIGNILAEMADSMDRETSQS